MDRRWARATGWLKHVGQQAQTVWSTAGDCNPIDCNRPVQDDTARASGEVKGVALPDFEGQSGTRWDRAAEVLNLARLPFPPRPHIQLL
jgi:hypothetical protein